MLKSRQGTSGSISTWAVMWILTSLGLQSGAHWCWVMRAGWLATRWILRLQSLEWPRATLRLATRLMNSSFTPMCKCMGVWVRVGGLFLVAQFLITVKWVCWNQMSQTACTWFSVSHLPISWSNLGSSCSVNSKCCHWYIQNDWSLPARAWCQSRGASLPWSFMTLEVFSVSINKMQKLLLSLFLCIVPKDQLGVLNEM